MCFAKRLSLATSCKVDIVLSTCDKNLLIPQHGIVTNVHKSLKMLHFLITMVFLKRQASIHFFRFYLNEYFHPFKDIKLHLILLVSNNDPTIYTNLKYMRFFSWATLLVYSKIMK